MNKAIYIDKDGTLIPDIPYNVDPDKITLRRGAGSVLHVLKQYGFKIIVISNQAGIAKGYFKEEALLPVKKKIDQLLKKYDVQLDGWYYCPHHVAGTVKEYAIHCECRKPKAGLIKKAIEDFNINPAESWMIGDILNDIEAGNKAGCNTILLDVGSETEWRIDKDRLPTYTVRSFKDIEHIILRRDTNSNLYI